MLDISATQDITATHVYGTNVDPGDEIAPRPQGLLLYMRKQSMLTESLLATVLSVFSAIAVVILVIFFGKFDRVCF